jgi:hypothetical protein
MNFENDIKIDETALDVECLEQPRLMMQYGQLVAEKEKELAKTKTNMEVVKADLDRDIRSDPAAYEIQKITETVVAGVIVLSPEYKEAEERVREATYEWKVAKAAVEAIQQKKDMLEALIRLHGQQYFAGPKIPRDLHEEWITKEKNKKGNEAVAANMRRRIK